MDCLMYIGTALLPLAAGIDSHASQSSCHSTLHDRLDACCRIVSQISATVHHMIQAQPLLSVFKLKLVLEPATRP
ncbi:hypothetical protein K493DRAFT_314171 [Basidiobolus meristosporus CBS 931.73]|uniref:Uncharacterized protein n=1 Tax=Basidiobolus meristosporus CBS 931.73 TaxID=1314790 RepID=A0A1Y1YGT6_9FUNG|nr:hypothetical protein K493DRAFT_314171 [Basidiobolus meristosporus CBS 931.73]|eukprot:ORX97197.1 hypothetical protein K493DRAFT_314171 [Basidiobolus meristosporus CBS 931.73]